MLSSHRLRCYYKDCSTPDAQESEVRTFIKEIWCYADVEELDEAVLNRLISKILIGEVKKVDGQKVPHLSFGETGRFLHRPAEIINIILVLSF